MTKSSFFKASRTRLCAALITLMAAVIWLPTAAASTNSDAWVSPPAMSLKKVSSVQHDGQGRLAYEDNLDCEKVYRRLNGTNQASTGCYGPTNYGSLDVRTNLISFAGTSDTAVPLRAYGPHDIFFPWPGTSSALSLSPAPSGGMYLGIYRDVLRASDEVKNVLGQITARQVNKPVDLQLLDNNEQRIRANFNSIAFSENGSWMVAETMSGSFVRINLATLSVKPFAKSYVGGGGRYDVSQLAVSPDGRHVAVANSGAESFRVYDLASCFSTPNNPSCKSAEYWPYIKSKDESFRNPVRLRFVNQELLSFIGITNNIETSYLIAPAANINSLTDYLALGDSYTSGEGAYNYKAGTDTETNGCRVSNNAYPALLTRSLFSNAGGHSIACSGAKIQDIINNDEYFGQTADGKALEDRTTDEVQRIFTSFSAGSVPQLLFAKHYQPAVTTLSVGGNDIGFGDLLKLCVAPRLSRHLTAANDCYATYEDRLELANMIDGQEKRLVSVFKKLQSSAPASTVYIVGYPLIAVDTGNCALNVQLNTSEIALSIEVIKQLNAVIERAAKASNVSFVDIEDALAGRRLCEVKSSRVAVHGITSGTDGGVKGTIDGRRVALNFLGKESFHPNAYGHELIASAIKTRTQGLQLQKVPISTKPKAAAPDSKLLKAPKSNRAVAKKQSGKISKTRSTARGAKLPISVKGKTKGLKPSKTYKVILKDGSNTHDLGGVSTDQNSDIEGTLVPLPIIQPGNYEIGIIGEDQLGEETIISDVITIIDSENDFDGDGITDDSDSCVTIFNADIDEDQDGVDDVCDSIIDDSDDSVAPGQGVINSPPGSSYPQPVGTNNGTPPNISGEVSPPPDRGVQVAYVKQPHISGVGTASTRPLSTPQPVNPSRASSILGYSVQPAAQIQPAGGELSESTFMTAGPYKALWRIPWIQILLTILTGFLLIKTGRYVFKKWRRKRDSNPRYP